MTNQNSPNRLHNWAFFFILAIGIGLRFFQLDYHSLWVDELVTWYECWKPSFGEFWKTYSGLELTPPLYYFFEFLVSRLFAASEWSIRLVGVLSGVGFIIGMYYFADELSGKKKYAGLAAAAFTATTYRAIMFSQEARSYSLMLCLAAFSSWAFLRVCSAAEGSQRWRRFIIYFIFASGLMYTHYFGVIAVMAQALTVLVIESDRRKIFWWFKAYLLVALAYLPWFYFLLSHPVPQTSLIKSGPPLNEFFVGHRELFGSSAVNYILAMVLAIVGVIYAQSRRKQAAVLAWVFLIFLLAWGVSQFRPIYSNRYFVVALAPMLATAAVGVSAFHRRRFIAIFLIFLFCGLGLHELFLGRRYFSHPKAEQVRQASAAAVELLNKNPDAGFALFQFPPFLIPFYLDRYSSPKSVDETFASQLSLAKPDEWIPALRQKDKIVALIFSYDPAEKIYELASGHWRVSDRRDFHLVTLALLERIQR